MIHGLLTTDLLIHFMHARNEMNEKKKEQIMKIKRGRKSDDAPDKKLKSTQFSFQNNDLT